MSWNLETKVVTGKYLGQFPIVGTVTESRVKYGGKVCNTITLQEPIVVFGSARNVVLMDSDEVTVV